MILLKAASGADPPKPVSAPRASARVGATLVQHHWLTPRNVAVNKDSAPIGHPWSICRGRKPRRAASIRDSCSRCLTRRGGCATFGMGWGWRSWRTPVRWCCTASHIWTRTCRWSRWVAGSPREGGEVSGDGQEKRRWRVGRIMRFVVIRTMLWGQIDDSGWIDLYDSTVTWFDLKSTLPEEFVHTENT